MQADFKKCPRYCPRPDNDLGRVVSIYDGDTLTLLCEFAGELARINLRILHVDCPELRGRSTDEHETAALVRDVVRHALLDKLVHVTSVGMDKYGRLLGDVSWTNHKSLSHFLLDAGMARAYEGASRGSFTREECRVIAEACRLREARDKKEEAESLV